MFALILFFFRYYTSEIFSIFFAAKKIYSNWRDIIESEQKRNGKLVITARAARAQGERGVE